MPADIIQDATWPEYEANMVPALKKGADD